MVSIPSTKAKPEKAAHQPVIHNCYRETLVPTVHLGFSSRVHSAERKVNLSRTRTCPGLPGGQGEDAPFVKCGLELGLTVLLFSVDE